MKVTVIGGAGVMGSFFAGVFRRRYEVVISDRDEDEGRRVAEALEAGFVADNAEAVEEADVVLLSTPMKEMPGVMESIIPSMKKGSLLMDLASVKSPVKEAFIKCSPSDIDFIGMHPMFCPPTKLRGQSIVLTPVEGGRWLPRIRDFFNSLGLCVHETTVEKHDELMAVVQGLIHVSFMGIASTLKELDYTADDLRPYMGKFHKILFDFIPRVTARNPGMYASIQLMNPNSSAVCGILRREITSLEGIIKEGDYDALIEKLRDTGHMFPGKEAAIERSDRLIDSYMEEV